MAWVSFMCSCPKATGTALLDWLMGMGLLKRWEDPEEAN